MTDPAVDMFCAQICSVGITTGWDPVNHLKGVRREDSTEEATASLRKGEKKLMKREDTRLPWCSMGLISHFPALTVNTLLFLPVLLTWTCDLPLVSDDTPMVPCSRLPRPGPGLVIHRLLDHLPQRIDFCFPPISRREANKRLKTLSVWSWIRILHRGDTLESKGWLGWGGHSWGLYISL